MLKSLLYDLREWVYPHFCTLCHRASATQISLCAECIASMPRLQTPLCPQCGKELEGSTASKADCSECCGLTAHYDFSRSLFKRDPKIYELILALKYANQAHLAPTLASFLPQLSTENPELGQSDWIITFVPMTHARTIKRGYNQSQELAKTYAKLTGCLLVPLLSRRNDNETHTRMSRTERYAHAQIAYKLKPKLRGTQKYKGRKVLLIDDVFTSGATAEACAAQLRKIGFSRIGILTLMRA